MQSLPINQQRALADIEAAGVELLTGNHRLIGGQNFDPDSRGQLGRFMEVCLFLIEQEPDMLDGCILLQGLETLEEGNKVGQNIARLIQTRLRANRVNISLERLQISLESRLQRCQIELAESQGP